jgi:hypothetical protein
MRTVEICLDGDAMESCIEGSDALEFYNAIGFLSTWGREGVARVEIGLDREAPDLIAYYYDPGGKCVFVLGAVWHDDHYGFHS